jgi:hypothetical protein
MRRAPTVGLLALVMLGLTTSIALATSVHLKAAPLPSVAR